MAIAAGPQLGEALCRILGLDPGVVRRITIVFEPDEPVVADVQVYVAGGKELLDVIAANPPEVRTVEVED